MLGNYTDGQAAVPQMTAQPVKKTESKPLLSRGTVDILNSLSC